MKNKAIPIRRGEDLVVARSWGREMARNAGLGLADQTRLATAISEVTRNALQHAGGGRCRVDDVSDDERVEIVVVVEDEGPGIPDIARAMTPGFSTANSLGAGLPGTQRITTEFEIESRPGFTRVRFAISRPRRFGSGGYGR